MWFNVLNIKAFNPLNPTRWIIQYYSLFKDDEASEAKIKKLEKVRE